MIRPEMGSLWKYVKSKDVYVCRVDRNKYAKGFPGSETERKNLRLSYSINNHIRSCSMLEALPCSYRLRTVGLFIHEDREKINDGLFAWTTGHDIPTNIHYDGTTASYCDGHVSWRSKKQLMQELTNTSDRKALWRTDW